MGVVSQLHKNIFPSVNDKPYDCGCIEYTSSRSGIANENGYGNERRYHDVINEINIEKQRHDNTKKKNQRLKSNDDQN
jgi:hypothetical protein